MRNVAVAIIAIFLAGCVVFPVPVPSTKTLSEEKTKSFVIGKTTYGEVVDQLGEPDERYFPGYVPRCFLYSDNEINNAAEYWGKNWRVCLAVGVYGGEGRLICDPDERWDLRLGFDGYGVLVDYVAFKHGEECWGSACPPASQGADVINMANIEVRCASSDEVLSSPSSKGDSIDGPNRSQLSESEKGGEGNDALWRYYNLIETDRAASYQSLCKSADYGNSKARNELGRPYEQGAAGLPKDSVMSLFWYRMSGYLDDVDVKYLDSEFSNHEIQSVNRLLGTWKPGDCEALVKRQLRENEN